MTLAIAELILFVVAGLLLEFWLGALMAGN
jgi:hypothetical protein